MIVRIKKNLKEGNFIPYNHPDYKDDEGASIVDEMLNYRGQEIEVHKSDVDDFYTGGDDNDYIWHRSWFVIPRKGK